MLDSSVPHNRLPERVGPLGTGVARGRVSTPRPARPSGARANEPGRKSWLPHDWFDPCQLGLALTGLVGLLMRDMALTRDEVDGLMAGLLTSAEPPTGTTRLADWLDDNADGLGCRYVSERRRNF